MNENVTQASDRIAPMNLESEMRSKFLSPTLWTGNEVKGLNFRKFNDWNHAEIDGSLVSFSFQILQEFVRAFG